MKGNEQGGAAASMRARERPDRQTDRERENRVPVSFIFRIPVSFLEGALEEA